MNIYVKIPYVWPLPVSLSRDSFLKSLHVLLNSTICLCGLKELHVWTFDFYLSRFSPTRDRRESCQRSYHGPRPLHGSLHQTRGALHSVWHDWSHCLHMCATMFHWLWRSTPTWWTPLQRHLWLPSRQPHVCHSTTALTGCLSSHTATRLWPTCIRTPMSTRPPRMVSTSWRPMCHNTRYMRMWKILLCVYFHETTCLQLCPLTTITSSVPKDSSCNGSTVWPYTEGLHSQPLWRSTVSLPALLGIFGWLLVLRIYCKTLKAVKIHLHGQSDSCTTGHATWSISSTTLRLIQLQRTRSWSWCTSMECLQQRSQVAPWTTYVVQLRHWRPTRTSLQMILRRLLRNGELRLLKLQLQKWLHLHSLHLMRKCLQKDLQQREGLHDWLDLLHGDWGALLKDWAQSTVPIDFKLQASNGISFVLHARSEKGCQNTTSHACTTYVSVQLYICLLVAMWLY